MLGLLLAVYVVRFALGIFANVTLLGELLFLEILIVCLWHYEQRFFPLVIIAFLWAGVGFPMQQAWSAARWAVLATGAIAGLIVWLRKPHAQFSAFHLIALFCVASAFVSATVSPLRQMAGLKALSLLLLFLYGSGGVRAAVLGRAERFFKGLVLGCEVLVYLTAIAYFAFGSHFWGNTNSLGAAMSAIAFPVLFWKWFTTRQGLERWRRLSALVLCSFLSFFSQARAGMVAVILLIFAFCFCLGQYKLLAKLALLTLGAVAVFGMLDPTALSESAASVRDEILYKGHKEEGVLGSRRTPWQKTVSNIKEHPWFGTGYGTSLTGEDIGVGFGKFSSTAETSREHGSSYMTIIEWVGFLGVLPFVALVGLNIFHSLRVGLWMRRSGSASHYSVPLAMVLFAALIHAGFEDWMFAVGSYLCVFFWSCSFMLVDLLPPLAIRVPARHELVARGAFSAKIASL